MFSLPILYTIGCENNKFEKEINCEAKGVECSIVIDTSNVDSMNGEFQIKTRQKYFIYLEDFNVYIPGYIKYNLITSGSSPITIYGDTVIKFTLYNTYKMKNYAFENDKCRIGYEYVDTMGNVQKVLKTPDHCRYKSISNIRFDDEGVFWIEEKNANYDKITGSYDPSIQFSNKIYQEKFHQLIRIQKMRNKLSSYFAPDLRGLYQRKDCESLFRICSKPGEFSDVCLVAEAYGDGSIYSYCETRHQVDSIKIQKLESTNVLAFAIQKFKQGSWKPLYFNEEERFFTSTIEYIDRNKVLIGFDKISSWENNMQNKIESKQIDDMRDGTLSDCEAIANYLQLKFENIKTMR